MHLKQLRFDRTLQITIKIVGFPMKYHKHIKSMKIPPYSYHSPINCWLFPYVSWLNPYIYPIYPFINLTQGQLSQSSWDPSGPGPWASLGPHTYKGCFTLIYRRSQGHNGHYLQAPGVSGSPRWGIAVFMR